jgi:class 3 adenylate cyclase
VTSGPLHGEGSAYPAGSTRESLVTETEPRSPTRTLVASFLFTDLVGFSIGSAAEQYAAKATLSAILRRNIAALREVDYRIKDTGDGALIAFVSNPEHALYMALAIAQDFGRAAADAGFPSNSLRTGLHLGSVKESIDMEARPNFVGDGINAAKRIMDFAAPGQITASRAFFDAVAVLDSAYATLFRHVGAPDDKHGRAHELYTISPSATVLEGLKLDLAAVAHESDEFAAKNPATMKVKQRWAAPVPTDTLAQSSHAVNFVRKWSLPVIGVIVLGIASIFVATKLTEPNGPKIPQASTEPVLAPASSKPAVPAPASAEVNRVDAQTPPAIPPKPDVANTVRAARVVEGAPTSDLTHPGNGISPAAVGNGGPPAAIGSGIPPAAVGSAGPPAAAGSGSPPTAAAKMNANIKPKTDATTAGPGSANAAPPAVAVPANAAPDRSSMRCSRIMEKATLGEALSTEEKRELASSCR